MSPRKILGKASLPYVAERESNQVVQVTVFAPDFRWFHWRVDGPVKAANQVEEFRIQVIPLSYSGNLENYYQNFIELAQMGTAPDIAFADSTQMQRWAEAGYLASLAVCQRWYPEFDTVIENLWSQVAWAGHLWGVPLEVGLQPLFFNKPKLHQIGWSESQIAKLPQQIQAGSFTLHDMIATAQEGIEKGVVEPGFGFWPQDKNIDLWQSYIAHGGRFYDSEQDKLVIVQDALTQTYAFHRQLLVENLTLKNLIAPDSSVWTTRLISRDAIAHSRVLFWIGINWEWVEIGADHVPHLGYQAYLFDNFGYALYPTALSDNPGHVLAGLKSYVITSESASGRQNQAAACALLAKTITAEINILNAATSTQLSVLNDQIKHPFPPQGRLSSETVYMLDNAWYWPISDQYHPYRDIILGFLPEVESGRVSPIEASTKAIIQLREQFGNSMLVE
jgi:inositol-phosphate transport system substrate-binding protein